MKILKFGAVWCPGCLVMRPRWQEIETENPEVETKYYDFDQSTDEVEKFKVGQDGLPVCIFLDNQGQEIERFNGEVSKEQLLQAIERNKNS